MAALGFWLRRSYGLRGTIESASAGQGFSSASGTLILRTVRKPPNAMAELFGGPLGPLIIFLIRIGDVSLATTRMLLSIRNQRALVPLIGFFEVLIWLFAVGNAVRFLDSPLHVIGYAGGFAAGTVVGMWVEERLAFGLATIRVISRHGGVELADSLREMGFGVTEFAGHGREGMVEVVYTVARRRDTDRILAEVDRWDADAFVTVEEPRTIVRGWMFAQRRK